MPMMSYQTDHSNELHQLLVSVSKYLFLNKDGLIFMRDEPLDVTLKNAQKTGKNHLVFYVLRDHYSGNFAYRIAVVGALPPLAEFLYDTWNNENGSGVLWGTPKEVWVPKTIASPELLEGLDRLGVRPGHPPSGFASGVQAIKSLEEALYIWLMRHSIPTLANLERSNESILHEMLWYSPKGDRRELWVKHLPSGHPVKPPDRDVFMQAFCALPGERVPLIPQKEKRGRPREDAGPEKLPEYSQEKLEKADGILSEAFETEDHAKVITLAFKALKTSPYCADAYNLLARESEDLQEKTELYRKAVAMGRIALGEETFREDSGHFWMLIDTRPFMIGMGGLADCLWKTGQTGEAIEIYREMLRLNPLDNQGVRYLLLYGLLEEDRLAEVPDHIREHGDGATPFAYGQALWSFCTAGPGGRSDDYLRAALKANPHVPSYLLGDRYFSPPFPAYYSPGDVNEALCYVQYAATAWKRKPAALIWLREMTSKG